MVWKQCSRSKSGAYIVVRLAFFFSSSCPNSQETPGGEKVYQQGADKKSLNEESDCRWVCKCLLCEPEETQAEIQAVGSLLLLLWLEYVHMNNKTE